jgi:hypothetical protein
LHPVARVSTSVFLKTTVRNIVTLLRTVVLRKTLPKYNSTGLITLP